MFGRFKKAFIIYRGNAKRRRFLEALPGIMKDVPAKSVNMDMVSMSGKNFFADQLLSLFSFYYHVGTPVSWTIFDDGSYTEAELEIFNQIPAVHVQRLLPDQEIEEMAKYPTLKKIFLLRDLKPVRPTGYADSDVLFFSSFMQHFLPYLSSNCYLEDENSSYFDKFLPADINTDHPLNLGFLLLNSIPDWSIATDYIETRIRNKELVYWSDQTAMHILATSEQMTPLPKDTFVVGGKDAFSLSDATDYQKIALRHFVGPVRHKMWQHSPEKVLNT